LQPAIITTKYYLTAGIAEIAIPLCLKVGEEANYTISVSENSFWETLSGGVLKI